MDNKLNKRMSLSELQIKCKTASKSKYKQYVVGISLITVVLLIQSCLLLPKLK